MIYALAKPIRQLLAVAILALLTVGFGLLVAMPVWSHVTSLQDRLEQARMMAGRLSGIANDDSNRRILEQQMTAARTSDIYIEGDSESIRLAALQSSLSGIVAAQGVKLRSARNLPARERHDLRLVGIQVQLLVPIDRLQKILLEIEQYKPVLIVEQLQMMPVNLNRLPDDDQLGLVDVRMDVLAIEAKQKDKT